MKKEIVIISVLSYLFLSSISIWGANRVVELGENIQTQVNASSAGDVVIIGLVNIKTRPSRLINLSVWSAKVPMSPLVDPLPTPMWMERWFYAILPCLPPGREVCALPTVQTLVCKTWPSFWGNRHYGFQSSHSGLVFTGNLTINGASDVEMVDSSCINLSVSGSSFHAVGSTFGTVTVVTIPIWHLKIPPFQPVPLQVEKRLFENYCFG